MIKKLTKYLYKYHGYELETYKVLTPKYEESKLNKVLFSIFTVITVLFVIDVFADVIPFMSFVVYFISFFFLLAIPLSKRDRNRFDVLIVTPELFIQRVENKKFTVIKIDDITKFSHGDDTVTIFMNEVEMKLNMTGYVEHLEILVDILEAKGKTFDRDRDFMKRPVEIIIEDGEIIIKDLKQEESKTEKLTSVLYNDYPFVTPGYLNEIIPKNASFEKVYYQENDLYVECSHLEIKDGHPENTSFGHMQVLDCLFVFLDSNVNQLSKKATNDRTSKFEKVEISKVNVIENLEKAVISEWRFKKNQGDLILAAGVGSVRLGIEYSDVLVAWKKVK